MTSRWPMPFYKQKEKKSDIFSGSFLDTPPVFCESLEKTSLKLDLSDECAIEKTIFDFILSIGFDLNMSGTRYLLSIIVQCVCGQHLPKKTCDLFKLAAEKFSQSGKAVEVAIDRALNSAKRSAIIETNRIFSCQLFPENDIVTTGVFVSNLCGYLVMLKAHQHGKTFFK